MTRKDIENTVSTYYKVVCTDMYSGKNHSYPYGGARSAAMWLLYSNKVMKSYEIAELFNITSQRVYSICAQVAVDLKSDTKIKEDIEEINELLNK